MNHNDCYVLYKENEDLDVYFHSFCEDIKGFLTGYKPKKIRNIYNKINKCSCGGDVILEEVEGMGDGSYIITCKKCGRTLERNSYDHDVTSWEQVLEFCIRDWNNGLSAEDITKANEKERERKRIKEDAFVWKEYRPNNIIQNPVDGNYCLVFAKVDGKLIGCKWSIQYQYKEIDHMYIDTNEIESYNLFVYDIRNIKGPLYYPEPSEFGVDSYAKEDTFSNSTYNSFGEFVRNYKTLEDAKQGAMARCGWRGINEDTVIKNVSGKRAEDF